jgi:hypothetical protein
MKMPYAAAGLKDGQIMATLGKHDLRKLWTTFKTEILDDDSLQEFDLFIEQLNDWEDVRYPPDGNLAISLNFVSRPIMVQAVADFAKYSLVINLVHIDRMFKAIMEALGIDREYVMAVLARPEAIAMYTTMNEYQLE